MFSDVALAAQTIMPFDPIGTGPEPETDEGACLNPRWMPTALPNTRKSLQYMLAEVVYSARLLERSASDEFLRSILLTGRLRRVVMRWTLTRRIGAMAFLGTTGLAIVFPYDTAEACRRASLPVCAPLYSCGPNCLHLYNNCGFGFRYHENLGGCRDQTSFLPAQHNVIIRGANGTLRAVTMC